MKFPFNKPIIVAGSRTAAMMPTLTEFLLLVRELLYSPSSEIRSLAVIHRNVSVTSSSLYPLPCRVNISYRWTIRLGMSFDRGCSDI